ncbi:STAS domain-containing protein [Pseudonocardia nigra]|uniref:STAS domain-containing protein n=1 Tax=Pseudonocardia nigra TaxID=1921578 RepID=UPI001C5E8711|nr:STAS domain-containing protein [Pseudonocardia nigra]
MPEPQERAIDSTELGPGLVIALRRPDPGVRILRVTGELHETNAVQLRLAVLEQLVLLPRLLVLDLTRVSALTPLAVEGLVQAAQDARRAAIALRIVPPLGPLPEALHAKRHVFDLRAGLEEAVQQFPHI